MRDFFLKIILTHLITILIAKVLKEQPLALQGIRVSLLVRCTSYATLNQLCYLKIVLDI